MRTSLRYVTTRAFKAYAVKSRVEWLLDWPGQVAICVSQMYWTAEVIESIRQNNLREYEQKCTLQLQGIVNKVIPVLYGGEEHVMNHVVSIIRANVSKFSSQYEIRKE